MLYRARHIFSFTVVIIVAKPRPRGRKATASDSKSPVTLFCIVHCYSFKGNAVTSKFSVPVKVRKLRVFYVFMGLLRSF